VRYSLVFKKIKAVTLHATQAQRGGRGIALPILNPGARRWWVASSTPQSLYPWKETHYSLYRRLAGPWSRFGWARKNLAPAEIQIPDLPAAMIRYTVYAMSATPLS
jgi:hypothetical protein